MTPKSSEMTAAELDQLISSRLRTMPPGKAVDLEDAKKSRRRAGIRIIKRSCKRKETR